MIGRRRGLGILLYGLVAGFGAIAVSVVLAANAAPASALPLIFNDALDQSGIGQTDYSTVQLAHAASDIQPGAILRFTIPWESIQPYCLGAFGSKVNRRSLCRTPGPYDWHGDYDLQSELDSISSYLGSGKVKLLPVIAFAPAWAYGQSATADPWPTTDYNPEYPDMPPGADPTALGWWRNFSAALIAWIEGRYGKGSLAGLEVWNEENDYPQTWSQQPDVPQTMADHYSQVLCSAYAGVRTVDSTLPVLFGGFDPADPTYLLDAYSSPDADIAGCMTAIGIHPYNVVNGSWVAPSTPGSPFAAGAGEVSQIAANAGDAGIPLWITEFGYPVIDPPTEAEQAAWDAEGYTLAPGLPGVVAMGIHTIFDKPADGFEICAAPGLALPAADELKQAVSGDPDATASC